MLRTVYLHGLFFFLLRYNLSSLGGYAPGVSSLPLPSTPVKGHRQVQCFPGPAATYLSLLMEDSYL